MTKEQKQKIYNALCVEEFLKVGKEKVLNDCIFTSLNPVQVWKTDEGLKRVSSFENWLNEKIYKTPDFMSLDMLKVVFDNELKALYLKECTEAMELYKAREEAGNGE